MSHGKLIKTEGIVIRRINFGEADQIVTLLCPDRGKIACVAKGSRRIKSKFCGRLELFYRVHVTGYQGRELLHLNEVEIVSAAAFEGTLPRHGALFAIAEATHRLVQDDQQVDGVYELLKNTLGRFAGGANEAGLLQDYLSELLCRLGFASEKKPALAAIHALLNRPLKSEAFLTI